jgi:hypothetical protein
MFFSDCFLVNQKDDFPIHFETLAGKRLFTKCISKQHLSTPLNLYQYLALKDPFNYYYVSIDNNMLQLNKKYIIGNDVQTSELLVILVKDLRSSKIRDEISHTFKRNSCPECPLCLNYSDIYCSNCKQQLTEQNICRNTCCYNYIKEYCIVNHMPKIVSNFNIFHGSDTYY